MSKSSKENRKYNETTDNNQEERGAPPSKKN